jgi:hypothetical protein
MAGLSAQTDSQAAAAAAGLLAPMSVQNLVTLAAMSQPSMQAAAANSPTAAQLTTAAQSLCKYPKALAAAVVVVVVVVIVVVFVHTQCSTVLLSCPFNITVLLSYFLDLATLRGKKL